MIKTETELRAGQSAQAESYVDALMNTTTDKEHTATDKGRAKARRYYTAFDIVILSLLVLFSIANLAIAIANHSN